MKLILFFCLLLAKFEFIWQMKNPFESNDSPSKKSKGKEALNLSPVAMFKRSQNKSTGKAKVIYGIDQSEGIAGPSAAHQQQNVSAQYHQELSKLELENRLLKAELKQKEMMDEIKELKDAKMEQQQKENDLVGQIQKLADEQKKCFDKYEALEKELARKYICIGQFAKLLSRIDKLEAQINGPKEIGQGTNSSMPNRNGMKIDLETMDGKIITLINVRPSKTIKQIMAKFEDIEHIPINQLRLIFNGYVLIEDRTLGDYGIENGDLIYIVQNQCGC